MQIEQITNIVFFIFLFTVIGGLVFFVYWNILYFVLTKKYDNKLFKQPFFNDSELGVYSVWPFGLVRATAYILLITDSSISKKRFKGLSEKVVETKFIQFLCHLWKITLLILAFMFLVSAIWGSVDMLILK